MNRLDSDDAAVLGFGCLAVVLYLVLVAALFLGACLIVKWVFF